MLRLVVNSFATRLKTYCLSCWLSRLHRWAIKYPRKEITLTSPCGVQVRQIGCCEMRAQDHMEKHEGKQRTGSFRCMLLAD
eukprot:6196223-Pleurochrysis_carterae.AAC.1